MIESPIILVSAIVLVSLGLLFGVVSPSLGKSLIDFFTSLFLGSEKKSETIQSSSEAGIPLPSSEESSLASPVPSEQSKTSIPEQSPTNSAPDSP